VYLTIQVVLNPGISKTAKIRVFNSATLVALSRLYVWGSASKLGAVAAKKRSRKSTDSVQFASVCALSFCRFFLELNGIEVILSIFAR